MGSMKQYFSLCAGVVAGLLLATSAKAATVEYGYRPGGYTVVFMTRAKAMLARGDRIVLTGDQMSAAAIQVAWYRQRGGKVCTKGDVQLFFHVGRNTATGAPIDGNKFYLGRSIREGWYSPSKFGIPHC